MNLNWRDASKELPDRDMWCDCILFEDRDCDNKEDVIVKLFFNHPTKCFIEDITRFYNYKVSYWSPANEISLTERTLK